MNDRRNKIILPQAETEEIILQDDKKMNAEDYSAYRKIAVTGGIGSGKSTVCNAIKQAGYPVFSCDEIYAQMLSEPDFAAAAEILFPGSVTDGTVQKSALLENIINNKGAAELLNAFTHPKIMDRLFGKMNEAAKTSGATKIFAEVPLLFEGGFDNLFDKILVVMRNETDKIQSVIARDHCKEETVRQKMSMQFDYSLPPQKENYPSLEKIIFINNDGSFSTLKKRLSKLLQEL